MAKAPERQYFAGGIARLLRDWEARFREDHHQVACEGYESVDAEVQHYYDDFQREYDAK